MALKRPNKLQYAMYDPRGKAKYKKDLAAYYEAKRKADAKKNKLSTEKNIKKQKTANKKASTTKTTKGTTTTTPQSTAAKGKSLATGKKTSKTKAVETPKTTTATKTRTTTRTQTKRKSTTKPATKKPESKKPATTKPATKKPATKKQPPKKQVAKRKPFEPVDSGKRKPFDSVDKSQKQTPKGNKSLKIGERFNNLTNKLKPKSAPKDQTPQQPVPEGKSKGAKIAKSLSKRVGNYAKQVYNKAALDTFKFKTISKDPSMRKANRAGVKGGAGAAAALTIGNALINRLTKPKGMSHKEWSDFKAKKEEEGAERRRKLVKKGYDFYGKRLKKVSSDLTGKKYESSTTKNINKQKKANTTPNRGLKIKKTQYSSKNARKKQDFGATTGTKQADKRFATFREGDNANLKLQQERQKGNTETYSRRLSTKAKKTKSNKTTTTKAPRPGSARARLRAKNVERFGKAHVDRLVAKNKEFQAIKRIKDRKLRKKKREEYRQKYGR